jgi:hypothetical protein
MLRFDFVRSNISTRIAACTALVALTAANSAQAATVRSVNHAAAVQAAAAVRAAANAPALTFTRIDDPQDPTFNQLLGIDDNGVISGYFGSAAKGHPNTGYTIAPPYIPKVQNFISDNLPSSTQTQATGITNSQTTSGFWAPTNLGFNNQGVPQDQNYGFIRLVEPNGTIVWLSVNDPAVSSTPKVNQVLGVNSSNNAVGFYNDSNGNAHGYIYSVATGKFSTPFTDSNAVSSTYTGINDENTISGFYLDGNNQLTKAFIFNGTQVARFLVPGSTSTQFFGVNNENQAVGSYLGKDNFQHGVVYSAKTNKYIIVNDPAGAQGTTLNGINDKHQAVGFYTDAWGNTHGLLVNNIPFF